jgi:hypothetical protein
VSSRPRPSARNCGSRNDISFWASGYSGGQDSSCHTPGGGGVWTGRGTNLFHALGNVPPSVATAPSSAAIRNSVRDTCQPPRLPAAADRHEWQANRWPAPATTAATSASTPASSPASAAANSKVKSAYSPARTSSNASKVTGVPGWHSVRYSAQFHQRRTNSRS